MPVNLSQKVQICTATMGQNAQVWTVLYIVMLVNVLRAFNMVWLCFADGLGCIETV